MRSNTISVPIDRACVGKGLEAPCRQLALVAVFLLLYVAAGCSMGSEVEPPVETTGGDEPSVDSGEPTVLGAESGTATTQNVRESDERLPLADIDRLRSDYQALISATDFVVLDVASACMANLGFERPPRFAFEQAEVERPGEAALLALDSDLVREIGYEATAVARVRAEKSGQQSRREAAQSLEFSEDWLTAWSGSAPTIDEAVAGGLEGGTVTGSGGCVGQAKTELPVGYSYSTLFSKFESVQDLWGSVFDLANSDLAHLDAQREWSRCMSESGYKFPDLISAFVAGDRLRIEGQIGQGIDQAQADASCQQRSGVVDAYRIAWRNAEIAVGDLPAALDLASWHSENYSLVNDAIFDYLRESGLSGS